jgi:hypothetical protein
MKLRVGIVGLGDQWEGRHLPALRMLADRFEVRGVCEQVSHRAERAAKELASAAVDGFRALAARDDIDAILFLADQWFGATPILAACDHGKAVYSAISFPLDPAEAEVLRAGRAQGIEPVLQYSASGVMNHEPDHPHGDGGCKACGEQIPENSGALGLHGVARQVGTILSII